VLPRRRLPRAVPPLKENWLPFYRLFWVASFLLAVGMSAGGIYVRAAATEGLTSAFERAGLIVSERQGRLRVQLPVGEEAARSGIRTGDRIIAIGGSPVSDDPAEYDSIGERLDGDAGTRVEVTTQSADGTVRRHILTRSQRHLDQAFGDAGLKRWMMRAADFTDVLTTMLLLAAAVLLFRRRTRDPVATLLSLGLLLNLAGSGSSEYVILKFGGDTFFDLLLAVGWAFLLLAILTFPDGRLEPRWTLGVALMLPVGAAIGYFHDFAGTLFDMAFMIAGVSAIAIRYRRSPPGDQRQQIRWALLGFAAGAFFIIVDQALLLAYEYAGSMTLALWSELLHYLVYSIAFACIPLGLLISLLRYRLYDADAAISRSAAYAVITILLSAVFAGCMNGVEAIIQASFGRDAGAEAPAVAAALTVLLVAPVHGRIHRWAEQRFQKALLHLRRDLPDCVADLRGTGSLAELLGEVIERVSTGVRATRAAVITGDRISAVRGVTAEETETWLGAAPPDPAALELDCDRSDSLFPMRIALRIKHAAGEPIGWLLLGPRPDGSFYGKDEQDALAEVADPIARAIQVVTLRQEREKQHEERLAALEAALAKLANASGRRDSGFLGGNA
jgi:hypothetical protein